MWYRHLCTVLVLCVMLTGCGKEIHVEPLGYLVYVHNYCDTDITVTVGREDTVELMVLAEDGKRSEEASKSGQFVVKGRTSHEGVKRISPSYISVHDEAFIKTLTLSSGDTSITVTRDDLFKCTAQMYHTTYFDTIVPYICPMRLFVLSTCPTNFAPQRGVADLSAHIAGGLVTKDNSLSALQKGQAFMPDPADAMCPRLDFK